MRTKVKTLNTLERQRARKGWVFVSPFVIGFVLVFAWVLIDSIRFSVNDLAITPNGYQMNPIGWEKYKQALFVNPDFSNNVRLSIGAMLLNIPVVIIFSLFLATLLNTRMRGRAIYRAIFFIPVILATGIIEQADMNNVVMNSMWQMNGIDTGVGDSGKMIAQSLQEYIQSLNISTQITDYIFGAINGIYDVINRSGVQLLIFLAGLQSISPAVYEAANIEGATAWESFWKITFPMISPMIFVNTIYTIIDSFTRSDNSVMDMIYTIAFTQSKYGLASAMAWLYFAVVGVSVALIVAIMYRFIFYEQKR